MRRRQYRYYTRREFLLQSIAGGATLATGWSAAGPTDWAQQDVRTSTGFQTAKAWEQEFANPPAGHRIGVYWWWFGPAVTKAEVARELEVMWRAGIGHVLIFPIYPISPDDPAKGIRNLRYLSPEFLDVLGFTTGKAKELGIATDILIGTGWPYGGPSITPELSAQRLRVEIMTVNQSGFAKPPQLRPYEKLEAAWLVKNDGKHINMAESLDVTESVKGSAVVNAPPGYGPGTLMAFIQSPTGMKVKRAALGGEGLVLDHLSRKAVQTYLDSVAAKILPATKGRLRALHSDSLEVFGEEWTPGFLDEFSRRRGYDLRPYLPALVSDIGPLTADVRHDYWRTVSDLAIDHYVRVLHEWCHDHGVGFQSESYGTPPVDLTSYSDVDYVMGEGYNWKVFTPSRWASSAAHQLGKRVTSAEAYTWLRHPRYLATLQDLKIGSDLHFVCGINKLVAHGYAYSPPAAGVPGWGYYASVMLNDNNTWWPYFHLLADYVHRVSYALSLGKPVVDVGLYLPEDDVMAGQPLGHGLNLNMAVESRLSGKKPVAEFGLSKAYQSESPVIKSILTSGFCFDGFDRSILRPDLRTAKGRLELGDIAYRIVVLPNLTGVSLLILEKLRDFCHAGGVLVATRRLPSAAHGVRNRSENHARVQELVAEIFGGESFTAIHRHVYGQGMGIFVPDEEEGLRQVLASLNPQLGFENADAEIAFVQRREGSRQIYFVTNTSSQNKTFTALFRDGMGAPRLWDPMTANVSDAPQFGPSDSGTRVPLKLDPYGSILIAFDGSHASPAILATDFPSSSLAFDKSKLVWTARVSKSGKYFVQTGKGKQEFDVKVPASRIAVRGPWSLAVGSGHATIRLEKLASWTELPQYKFYSGHGTYEVEVDLPPAAVSEGCGLWIDLGEVREIAQVAINGNEAGVCWKLPYQLDISPWAKAGKNRITVKVTNLLINRVLGQPEPDYSGLPHPLRFPLPEEKKLISAPLPSGLLGPVQIIPYLRVPIG